MVLVGRYVDDEYFPEFATLVVRDADGGSGWAEVSAQPRLEEFGSAALPAGTFARAGLGWLFAGVGSEYQRVELEARDADDPDDGDRWPDELTTPYLSRTGTVALGFMTGGTIGEVVRLGKPGAYVVRVARRADERGGHVWRLTFRPGTDTRTLPAWLARSGPPVSADEARLPSRYGPLAADIVSVVTWGPRDGLRLRIDDLAGRLLASPGETGSALSYGVAAGWLAMEGDLSAGVVTLRPWRAPTRRGRFQRGPPAPTAPRK